MGQRVYAFHESKVLVKRQNREFCHSPEELESLPVKINSVWNTHDNTNGSMSLFDLSESYEDDGWELAPIKSFIQHPCEDISILSTAFQLNYFNRTHSFCGICSTNLSFCNKDRAKKCLGCGHVYYPRISPVAMVMIIREGKILLARGSSFPPGRYSVIAGFIEPGERAEDAAKREVMEEVNLEIKNISYFGSQAWPVPHSLIIAFICEYSAGEITIADDELEEAGWFSPDEMPELPPSGSISRKLIDEGIRLLS